MSAYVTLRDRAYVQVFDMDSFQQAMGGVEGEIEAQVSADQPNIYRAIANPRPDDGLIDLTLHAGLSNPSVLNYAAKLDMVVDGTVVNSCEFLPARAYYPTTLWQPDSVINFTATIPNCAGALDSPIELRLLWLGADMTGVIQEETSPITLARIDPPLAQAATCPETLGTLAGGYIVTKFNSPPSVRIGETYLPSANWVVTNPSPEVAGRVFIFTHNQTGEQYTCAVGDHPASSWLRGEYVYFDRCPGFSFPPEATPGEYTASVVMLNGAGELLPATDTAGEPLPGNAVALGTVSVEG
jgi:hypothetical protein